MVPPRQQARTSVPARPKGITYDVARAFMVTPPAEEDDEAQTQVVGRCLLKICDQYRDVDDRLRTIECRDMEEAYHNRRRIEESPRSTISSSYLEYCDAQIEEIKEPIDGIIAAQDDIVRKLDDIGDQLSKHSDDIQTLSSEIGDVEARLSETMDQNVQTMERRFDVLESRLRAEIVVVDSRANVFRNSLISRPHDVVAPLAYLNSTSSDDVKVFWGPRGKTVTWWWRLHRPEKRKDSSFHVSLNGN